MKKSHVGWIALSGLFIAAHIVDVRNKNKTEAARIIRMAEFERQSAEFDQWISTINSRLDKQIETGKFWLMVTDDSMGDVTEEKD